MRQIIKLSSLALAVSLALPAYSFDWKPAELPIQFGGYWGSAGKAQHININGAIGDQFTNNSNSASNGLIGVGYFLDGYDADQYNILYGLNAFYLGNLGVNGTIVQENLFSNLTYSYDIQNIPLYFAAKAKINSSLEGYNFIVDVGIGPNFMETRNYRDRPTNAFTLHDRAFVGSNNSVTFTATAGIGLRVNQILGKAPVECGYRFFYLGQGQLNPRTNQIVNNLSTGSAYANALVCGFTI